MRGRRVSRGTSGVRREEAGARGGGVRVAEGVRAASLGAARGCRARFLRGWRAVLVPGRGRGRTVQQVRGRPELSSSGARAVLTTWRACVRVYVRVCICVRAPARLIFG